jgi:hypothetical protein
MTTLDDHLLFVFRLDLISTVQSTYSSVLNGSSETFPRDKWGTSKFYYQALQINVSITGQYGFLSNTNISTYGYLYRYTFDQMNPTRNQISQDDAGCDNGQFWLQSSLQKDTVYILVVTTSVEGVMGAFSIVSKGVANLTFRRLGESDCLRVFVTAKKSAE